MLKRLLIVLSILIVSVLAIPTVASADTCPTGWGSLPKDSSAMGTGEVDTLRTGQHECYDRVVIDIDGPPAGYHVAYVDQVLSDPKGDVVSTPGGAKLQFTVRHPNLHGTKVGTKVANVTGYRTLRSVVYAGSFEGLTTYGVGVRSRVPFRVFTIPGGHGRIVLDVAHHW